MCVRVLFWGVMFIVHVLHFQNVYVFSGVKHVLHEKKKSTIEIKSFSLLLGLHATHVLPV